jgi:hypothetical protein
MLAAGRYGDGEWETMVGHQKMSEIPIMDESVYCGK